MSGRIRERYDEEGKYIGYDVIEDGYMEHYDKDGNYIGYSDTGKY